MSGVLVTYLDQAHGGRPDRLPGRTRRQGSLPAFRYRYGGAGGDHPRPAPGEFRRAGSINLLREGLDMPEVSLVAILDADKEGFLRSETTLIQTIGRAARNINGKPSCMPTW